MKKNLIKYNKIYKKYNRTNTLVHYTEWILMFQQIQQKRNLTFNKQKNKRNSISTTTIFSSRTKSGA